MALPKEPRQKMINIMYLVLTAILALNVSAEVIEAFKTVDKSLEASSKNIAANTSTTSQSLFEQTNDPKTAEKAGIWYPKAKTAMAYSAALNSYIESLKKRLRTSAGSKDSLTDFKEDNLDASTRMFEKNGEGAILKQKLEQYKKDMLGIDTAIAKYFGPNGLPINTDGVPGADGKVKDFTASYFHMTPTVAALTMLSKFQNNVKNAENQVVTYCQSQVGAVKVVYDQFKTIIGTSSTYLMPGEQMTVTAGIGSFSKSAAPTITINGKAQQADADGVAISTFPVSGSGSVHVSVKYTKPDGTFGVDEKDIPYTVGQPSSAAVTLDAMDVFYIGLANPITIASPTGMDRTSVSATGCTLGGSGTKRTVSVTAPGTCTITVSPQGSTPFTHTYRIKRIPEPEFKVGSGKPRMTSVEFKSQTFARADMGPDFIYDVKYSVVSATVYFGGAGFQNVATGSITGGSLANIQQYISRCVPGSSVSFDNVKVQGPDGVRAVEGKTYQLF